MTHPRRQEFIEEFERGMTDGIKTSKILPDPHVIEPADSLLARDMAKNYLIGMEGHPDVRKLIDDEPEYIRKLMYRMGLTAYGLAEDQLKELIR